MYTAMPVICASRMSPFWSMYSRQSFCRASRELRNVYVCAWAHVCVERRARTYGVAEQDVLHVGKDDGCGFFVEHRDQRRVEFLNTLVGIVHPRSLTRTHLDDHL